LNESTPPSKLNPKAGPKQENDRLFSSSREQIIWTRARSLQ